MSVMGGILAGSAPLRGRANLELVVQPFPYRLAAGYWEVTDPRLAVMLHSIVGGTPAHRRLVNDDLPADVDDLDACGCSTLNWPHCSSWFWPHLRLGVVRA